MKIASLRYLTGVIIFVTLFQTSVSLVHAQTVAPAGFHLVRSANGVELYRKDYPGGSPDYVQVIDFNLGAAFIPLVGPIQESRPGSGVYGGDDPRIALQSLRNFWDTLTQNTDQPFCISNGQFFYMPERPTRLPFPLKVNGQIISDGYDNSGIAGQVLILELWGDHADIQLLDGQKLYQSSAPNIVAGLIEDGRKSPSKYVPRTFVGVDDRNGDGLHEIVLIFNSQSARQGDAADVLREFGADKVMMLDGGGSTQLICGGESIIPSDRQIPQAIGVVAGTGMVSQSIANQSAEDQNAFSGFFLPFTSQYGSSSDGDESTQSNANSLDVNSPSQDSTDQLNPPMISLGNIRWLIYPMLSIAVLIFFIVYRLQQSTYA